MQFCLYSPSYLGQETAKGPFADGVTLPPAHLYATHGGGFTLFFFNNERQAVKWSSTTKAKMVVFILLKRRFNLSLLSLFIDNNLRVNLKRFSEKSITTFLLFYLYFYTFVSFCNIMFVFWRCIPKVIKT